MILCSVVLVRVAVVLEAALLDDELAGVLARAVPSVPSERTLARGALQRLDCLSDGLALGVAIRACDRVEADLEAAFSRILDAETEDEGPAS